jgi:hypothetical protein
MVRYGTELKLLGFEYDDSYSTLIESIQIAAPLVALTIFDATVIFGATFRILHVIFPLSLTCGFLL